MARCPALPPRVAAISMSLFVLACALPAVCGSVSGRLLDPRDLPCPQVYTTSTAYGESAYLSATRYTGPDGAFSFTFPAGTYTQGFSESAGWPLLYRHAIVVPPDGDAPWADLRYQPASFCFGTEPVPAALTSCCQSFRATSSGSLVSVGVRCSAPDGGVLDVTILAGEGPSAPQTGPTRQASINAGAVRSAYWSAGEVELTAGNVYTVRITLSGGGVFSPYRQSVRYRMRAESPDSRTWLDGVESSEPLEITVNQDDGGLTNTVCCARAGGPLAIIHAGQTFVARGTSVAAVTWASSSTVQWIASVHETPVSPKIGPAKYVYGYGYGPRSIATWAPGEVPTVPGQSYCVKVRQANDQSVMMYTAGTTDLYAGGNGWVNGVQKPYDMAIGIYEEKASGELDRPRITIDNLRTESITASSAQIRWETPGTASDSTVEYGQTTPYAFSTYQSALTTSHSVALTNLQPNRMYHVRVRSAASGCRIGVSADMVFVTAASSANLLADSGFESGGFGAWTRYGTGDIRVTGPWTGGSGPHSGSYGLAGAAGDSVVNGGVYQRVAATPGQEYRLSAWLFTHCEGDLYSRARQTVTRIGIDPNGGTDPHSTAVVWSPLCYSQDCWTQVATAAFAASSYVTVFLSGGNDEAITASVFAFDDVVLTAAAATPIDATIHQALGSLPDGSLVRITGAICTATAAQAGAFYVEETNRVAGIGVETADAMAVGERVTVTGVILTKTTGERYLSSASVTARSAGSPIRPFCTRSALIGGRSAGPYCPGVSGAAGIYNVGMLYRVCGTVTDSGPGYVLMDDGSMPYSHLQVNTTSVSNAPSVGETAAVTGIVQLEDSAGSATPVLRPRSNLDIDVL